MAEIIMRNAPAATNPVTAGYKGRVVIENGVANECVLSGAAAGTSATRPIGIVVSTPENRVGGRVAICISGLCDAIVGAAGALTKGTHTAVASDAAGAITPLAVEADDVWAVGAYIADAEVGVANNGVARVLVSPIINIT